MCWSRGPIRTAAAGALLMATVGCQWQADRPSNAASPRVEALTVADRPRDWLALPNTVTSVKFAVIGDSGRGWKPQHDVAATMARYRERFAFSFVVMLGDNIYEGPASAHDYRVKFEHPYRALLDAGVRFFAVLGNHDDPRQRDYAPFNMGGERYYSFTPPADLLSQLGTRVRFFAVDSTSLDGAQLAWLGRTLEQSDARWKICLLHHPLYSPGRYRTQARLLRWRLESLFVQHGVDAVFSGHEHFYARSLPLGGIVYFISGAAGSLRRGEASSVPEFARSFDRDFHFMLIEIDGDTLHFQAIARSGRTVDAGSVRQAPGIGALPLTKDSSVLPRSPGLSP